MRNQSGVEVRVQDGEMWLTQKAIGQLFGVDRSVVTKHLQCIYAGHEADESSTCANFAQVAKMQETRNKNARRERLIIRKSALSAIFCFGFGSEMC